MTILVLLPPKGFDVVGAAPVVLPKPGNEEFVAALLLPKVKTAGVVVGTLVVFWPKLALLNVDSEGFAAPNVNEDAVFPELKEGLVTEFGG